MSRDKCVNESAKKILIESLFKSLTNRFLFRSLSGRGKKRCRNDITEETGIAARRKKKGKANKEGSAGKGICTRKKIYDSGDQKRKTSKQIKEEYTGRNDRKSK